MRTIRNSSRLWGGLHPPGADTPPDQAPPAADTPPGTRHPPSREQTPSGPGNPPSGADTPPEPGIRPPHPLWTEWLTDRCKNIANGKYIFLSHRVME